MRIYNILILFGLMASCSKPSADQYSVAEEISAKPSYDTTAIDSFSKGATSVNIARQIKISSKKYQDSLRAAQLKAEQEKLLATENAEKIKAEKLKLEKEKAAKKLEDAKKTEEAAKAENTAP